jgi:hypothetical protein
MKEIYQRRLGELLAEEVARGVSLAQIARDVGEAPDTLGRWKQRGSLPRDLLTLLLLCRRLCTHPSYLLGWCDQRYPPEPSCAAELDAALKANRRRSRQVRPWTHQR